MKKVILGVIISVVITSSMFLAAMATLINIHISELESISENFEAIINELEEENHELCIDNYNLETNILNMFNGESYTLSVTNDEGVTYVHSGYGDEIVFGPSYTCTEFH